MPKLLHHPCTCSALKIIQGEAHRRLGVHRLQVKRHRSISTSLLMVTAAQVACTKLVLPQVSVCKHGAWVQRGSAPFYGVGVCGWPVCKLGCLHQALTASGVCAQARRLGAAGERPLLRGWGVRVACVEIGVPAPRSYCLRCLCASTALGCSGGAPPSTGLGCAGGLCVNWGACTKLLLPQASVRKHGACVQRGSAPF
jgi:hypothetical protein